MRNRCCFICESIGVGCLICVEQMLQFACDIFMCQRICFFISVCVCVSVHVCMCTYMHMSRAKTSQPCVPHVRVFRAICSVGVEMFATCRPPHLERIAYQCEGSAITRAHSRCSNSILRRYTPYL